MTAKISYRALLVSLLSISLLLTLLVGCGKQKNVSSTVSEDIQGKYIAQNQALNLGFERDTYRGNEHTKESKNYLRTKLAYYTYNTDIEISVAEIQEYLSEEFEPDGSIRMYDNGNWPNIQEYVEWYTDNQDSWETFISGLDYTLIGLENTYPELSEYRIPTLSFENLEELIKVHFDSNYEPQFIFDGRVAVPVEISSNIEPDILIESEVDG